MNLDSDGSIGELLTRPSASIATLIRLKFLADLSDLTDILCTIFAHFQNPPFYGLESQKATSNRANTATVMGTDAMVWTLVEPGVAIVASSLVTIRPLLRAWRLNGFTSTDRTPGMSGHISGHISGGMRSGTARSAPRSAPRDPYGTDSIDGIDTDLELGGIGKHEPMPRPNSRLGYPGPFSQGGSKTAGTQHGSDYMAPPNRRQDSNTKSEMYVIEGDKASDTWTGDRLGSPSVSSVDLDGLDAQSQHSGRVGLGGGRRDR